MRMRLETAENSLNFSCLMFHKISRMTCAPCPLHCRLAFETAKSMPESSPQFVLGLSSNNRGTDKFDNFNYKVTINYKTLKVIVNYFMESLRFFIEFDFCIV